MESFLLSESQPNEDIHYIYFYAKNICLSKKYSMRKRKERLLRGLFFPDNLRSKLIKPLIYKLVTSIYLFYIMNFTGPLGR